MKNKGFVLTETLVVIIFVLLIFTLLYNNTVPLLGKYEEISYYDDLDTTYDLYHYRLIIERDSNYSSLVSENYILNVCDRLSVESQDKCDILSSALNIDFQKDELIMVSNGHLNDLKDNVNVSTEIKEYLDYVEIKNDNALLLQHDGYVSYINLKIPSAPTITIEMISGTAQSTGYQKGMVVEVTCESTSNIASFSTKENNGEAGTYRVNDSNIKIKRITFNIAGAKRQLIASCVSVDGLSDTVTKTYAIYEYSSSSSCKCLARSNCKTKYGSWKNIQGSSCASSTSTRQCKAGTWHSAGGNEFCLTSCRSITKYSDSTCPCTKRDSCWHT